MVVPPLPDLTTLSHAQKNALIVALWERVVSLTARLTALEQRLWPCCMDPSIGGASGAG